MKYFFDTEDGPTRKTSHPNFVASMKAEFYYDCTDEFSPFGNDDGADLLFKLEDWYREKKLIRNIVRWLFNNIDEMGFKYRSKGLSEILALETLNKIEGEDKYFFESMDNAIIAAGFGQIKITGKIDAKLKDLTIIALDRQLLLNENGNKELHSRLEKMKVDLLNFE